MVSRADLEKRARDAALGCTPALCFEFSSNRNDWANAHQDAPPTAPPRPTCSTRGCRVDMSRGIWGGSGFGCCPTAPSASKLWMCWACRGACFGSSVPAGCRPGEGDREEAPQAPRARARRVPPWPAARARIFGVCGRAGRTRSCKTKTALTISLISTEWPGGIPGGTSTRRAGRGARGSRPLVVRTQLFVCREGGSGVVRSVTHSAALGRTTADYRHQRTRTRTAIDSGSSQKRLVWHAQPRKHPHHTHTHQKSAFFVLRF